MRIRRVILYPNMELPRMLKTVDIVVDQRYGCKNLLVESLLYYWR